MPSEEHERIARRLARKLGTPYKPERRGPDIQTPQRVIEVGTDPARVQEEMRQVQRSKKARYVAGPNDFVKAAVGASRGKGIGVMNQHGKIVKRAVRRGKK